MVVGWFWGLGFLVFSLGLIAFRVYRALGFRVRRLGGDHTMGGGGGGLANREPGSYVLKSGVKRRQLNQKRGSPFSGVQEA